MKVIPSDILLARASFPFERVTWKQKESKCWGFYFQSLKLRDFVRRLRYVVGIFFCSFPNFMYALCIMVVYIYVCIDDEMVWCFLFGFDV